MQTYLNSNKSVSGSERSGSVVEKRIRDDTKCKDITNGGRNKIKREVENREK